MGKIYAPKLMTVSYKDKNLNVKIPVRVRLIEMNVYECKKCRRCHSLKGWEEISEKIEGDHTLYKGRWIAEKMIPTEGNTLLCPSCDSVLVKKGMNKVKLYSTLQRDYIRIDRLLNAKPYFNFRYEYGRRMFVPKVADYKNDVEEVYAAVDALIECQPKNFSIEVNRGITMEQLKKCLQDEKDRKLIREI